VVAPRYQSDIRVFAEDLQAGKVSADGALKAAEQWGQAVYGGPVKSFLIDCGPGPAMELPDALVDLPAPVMSYAAAHFRPRSLARDQCAVVVVAPKGGQSVVQQTL